MKGSDLFCTEMMSSQNIRIRLGTKNSRIQLGMKNIRTRLGTKNSRIQLGMKNIRTQLGTRNTMVRKRYTRRKGHTVSKKSSIESKPDSMNLRPGLNSRCRMNPQLGRVG